jgi:hypothetical protein
VGGAVTGSSGELFYVVKALESITETRRMLVGAGIAIANLFFCGFYERYLVGPGWSEALVTLLAIETGLLITLAMAIQLQLIEPILEQTRIHPVTSRNRFGFVILTLLRHRYIVLFWGSTVLSMTLMVHPAPGAIFFVVLAYLIPGVASVVVSATLLILLKRWSSSGSVALALLALLACLTSAVTIVFPESHALDLFMPLRWSVQSCTAALQGDLWHGCLLLAPFVLLMLLGWGGGSRYA